MPLIILSGYPSSGKTHRADQLVAYFTSKIQSTTTTTSPPKDPSSTSTSPHPCANPSNSTSTPRLSITHISDPTLSIPRSAYRAASTEKEARGAQYADIKRALGKDVIVIADGMNYIKGWRYQLYCEAKALGTGSCVIHIGTPIPKCRELNDAALEGGGGYEPDIFDNLIYRYEEPNGMTRWDSPLFTVPFEDEHPPYEAIWDAVIGREGKARVVKPNMATLLQPSTPTDYLYDLDKTTQEILTAILTWQKDHPGESGQRLNLNTLSSLNPNPHSNSTPLTPNSDSTNAGDEVMVVELPSTAVTLPQLQRIRRQFIALNRTLKLPKARIGVGFVEYLNGNLA